ncbi:MAG: DUF2012 domain-containing protein [Bryobacteraceae bacterium]
MAAAAWTSGGKYGYGLSFNGSSSYVELGNPVLFQQTGSMTWSAWIKASANTKKDDQIIAKSNNSSGWQLKTTQDTGAETFAIAISTRGGRVQRYSTTVRQLNTWYHVAGVYNATSQTLDIYVNGVLNNGVLSGTVQSSQINSNVNVNIGRRFGGDYFNGVIDDVRVYNRTLTQAEIQSDMAVPVSSPAPPVTYSISGKVSGSAAKVTLTGASSASVNTDASGNYTFPGLPNGSYVVTPSQAGFTFSPSSTSVTINSASISALNFTATATTTTTYSISGKVSGSAAKVILTGSASGSVNTDTSGNFSFSGLPNGSYVITPSQSGYTFSPVSAAVTILGASQSSVNFTATAVPVSHSVTLTWTMSTSPSITGYNVYRGTVAGGPYTKMNSSPVSTTSYLDSSVTAGATYFYVSTTVQSATESSYSNQAAAVVPTP